MNRIMLKSKIHRATVTDVNLEYEGSIAIDEALLECAGILPYEKVDIYNVTNGVRFQTYTIPAPKDSGSICINGAAARLVSKGDVIIIASYSVMEDSEAREHKPVLVYVDGKNRVSSVKSSIRQGL